jgi:putative N6-adenine-specific DNA methylase
MGLETSPGLLKIFAVSAPGLEPFTSQELRQMGISLAASATAPGNPAGEEEGGIEFSGYRKDIYRANLHLRTASRILVRLGEFYAASFSELRKKASRLPWEKYLKPGQPVSSHVTCRKSRLYHSDAVAERVQGAIEDHMGKPSAITKPAKEGDEGASQLIIVRLNNDMCTISIDSSGELLHRRGYRLETAKAPLRETLAAGLLLASGWDGVAPLIDPFCGSGTIPIEAALMANHIPPGLKRRFSFMEWPGFSVLEWQKLLAEAQTMMEPAPVQIIASDRDAGAIQIVQSNAERAGVAQAIQANCQAVSAIDPPASPGWIVTNPPYGVRVSSNHDLRNLYAQFGKTLRLKCPGWKFGILCSDPQLLGNTGLEYTKIVNLVNGGIAVRFAIGQV